MPSRGQPTCPFVFFERDLLAEIAYTPPTPDRSMLVRLDRLSLSPEQVERPIPSLSEKQFIAAKVKRSADEERLERELFWYRQELLRRIRLVWNKVCLPSITRVLLFRGLIRYRCRSEACGRERSDYKRSNLSRLLWTSYVRIRCKSICGYPARAQPWDIATVAARRRTPLLRTTFLRSKPE